MKILLTAINAKFIHSSLAIRSLRAYAAEFAENIELAEYTINNRIEYIVSDIYKKSPDYIGFSCYIWNIEMIRIISARIKKVLPNTVVFFGGPEVSYDSTAFLLDNPQGEVIIRGEGEETFRLLSKYWVSNIGNLDDINGITYRAENVIFENAPSIPMHLDDIPFVYDAVDDFQNKIIYYETQRGCPYNCQYCLSSIEKGVRFLSMNRVKKDLDFFLRNKVRQVKFVDRTFNANFKHAMGIWKYIIENDNGVTNFHMEITADIMTKEMLDMLKNARRGLFQLEIGVQSTNEDTISTIKRNTSFLRLSEIVLEIKKGENIHQHLDLIAGLPHENYESFKNSFNDVYALAPNQLQMGFLKLLKGSGLRRDAEGFGIFACDEAPYEVLYTKELSYGEMLQLKDIEEMLETFYNSGKALNTIDYIVPQFLQPFEFYEKLAIYWDKNGHFTIQHNKMELFALLYDFICSIDVLKGSLDLVRELLRFDIYIGDNIKTIPDCLGSWHIENEKNKMRSFYNDNVNIEKYFPYLQEYDGKQIARMCHIELFAYDVYNEGHKKETTAVLFDYIKRDRITNKAVFHKIAL